MGSEIVLGKLSGRTGFAARVERLGIVLSPAELRAAFARFQRVADEVDEVDDARLRAICACPRRSAGAEREAWPGPGI